MHGKWVVVGYVLGGRGGREDGDLDGEGERCFSLRTRTVRDNYKTHPSSKPTCFSFSLCRGLFAAGKGLRRSWLGMLQPSNLQKAIAVARGGRWVFFF